MSAPDHAAAFLTALWRYLAAAGLYRPGHPHRREVADEVYAAVEALLATDESPSFSLLDGEVVYGNVPLRDLRAGEWARKLEEAGVSRLEMARGLGREEAGAFLDGLAGRVHGDESEGAVRLPHVRYGPLGLLGGDERGGRSGGLGRVPAGEEADAVGWVHGQAARRGEIPVAETLAVVQSLSVAMHGARRIISPFLKIKETDQYTAGHCINVSILSMSLAEELGMPAAVVRAVGAGGLLHDIGKVTIPDRILGKPGRLTPEERQVVERHPVEGCRMLLASGEEMALPAMIAYEHHMGWHGGGYPRPRFPRRPMRLSRLVQVCDFYDALRTRRRYRAPLPPDHVIRILHENRETKLDPELTDAFIAMIQRWDPAVLLSEDRGDAEDRPDAEGALDAEGASDAVSRPDAAPPGEPLSAGADADLAY